MIDGENFMLDEGGIDLERIQNDKGGLVDELCCTICQGLLWNPTSCSSCQHLFCKSCIETWLHSNPSSCPFRCSPYEAKRAPPHIHSLLSRLSIRCRNSLYGCTEFLPYNLLTQHETSQCQFPTKQCKTCRKYILENEIIEHEMNCKPAVIQCFICKCHIDRSLYDKHYEICLQEGLNRFITQMNPPTDGFADPVNNAATAPQQNPAEPWLTQFNNRLRQYAIRTPHENLIGADAFLQAREQSNFVRIWSTLRLIALNRSQSLVILFLLLCGGIGNFVGISAALFVILLDQVRDHIYRSFTLIIFFTGSLCFGLPIFLEFVHDIWIILFIVIGLTLWSSTNSNLAVEFFGLKSSFAIVSIAYLFLLLCLEVSLLIVRIILFSVPPYISAGCLAWTLIFITFHFRY